MSNKNSSPQDLENRLIQFASRIISLSESLPNSPAGKYLGGQILRSGSSPALNYGEAQAAESKADFVHKMKICLKELRETLVCLKIIEQRNFFSNDLIIPIMKENDELVAIFVSSIKTIKTKSKQGK